MPRMFSLNNTATESTGTLTRSTWVCVIQTARPCKACAHRRRMLIHISEKLDALTKWINDKPF
jgi:hypothetical protein